MFRTILTTAHCIQRNITKKVYSKCYRLFFGAMDLNQTQDGMYMVKINNIEIHEKYDKNKKYKIEFDFAIITLDCEIDFDEKVAPVCLPKEAACNNPTSYENRSASSTGF